MEGFDTEKRNIKSYEKNIIKNIRKYIKKFRHK